MKKLTFVTLRLVVATPETHLWHNIVKLQTTKFTDFKEKNYNGEKS